MGELGAEWHCNECCGRHWMLAGLEDWGEVGFMGEERGKTVEWGGVRGTFRMSRVLIKDIEEGLRGQLSCARGYSVGWVLGVENEV